MASVCTQYVYCDGVCGDILVTNTEVSQGCCLSPLLLSCDAGSFNLNYDDVFAFKYLNYTVTVWLCCLEDNKTDKVEVDMAMLSFWLCNDDNQQLLMSSPGTDDGTFYLASSTYHENASHLTWAWFIDIFQLMDHFYFKKFQWATPTFMFISMFTVKYLMK